MAAKRSSTLLAQVLGNLFMLMARLAESWRTIRLLTHKATALSPIACVLFPALSTVGDFPAYALPELTSQFYETQRYGPEVSDKANQDLSLACSRSEERRVGKVGRSSGSACHAAYK